MIVSQGRVGWSAMTDMASQLSIASGDRDATDESGRCFGWDYCATTCSPVMDPAIKDLEIQGSLDMCASLRKRKGR